MWYNRSGVNNWGDLAMQTRFGLVHDMLRFSQAFARYAVENLEVRVSIAAMDQVHKFVRAGVKRCRQDKTETARVAFACAMQAAAKHGYAPH